VKEAANVPLLVRIDNRLVHGQVLEAWVPALEATCIWVIDDEAAGDELTQMAMSLAIPPRVTLTILTVAQATTRLLSAEGAPPRALLLLREVQSAVRLAQAGVKIARLNLGNIHFRAGRKQVAPTLYLDAAELEALESLARAGTDIEWRAVPADVPLSLAAMRAKHLSH
jgi:mannose/fructose/N-acetylgalactosamine-specific phosphotransferase system component IIB